MVDNWPLGSYPIGIGDYDQTYRFIQLVIGYACTLFSNSRYCPFTAVVVGDMDIKTPVIQVVVAAVTAGLVCRFSPKVIYIYITTLVDNGIE